MAGLELIDLPPLFSRIKAIYHHSKKKKMDFNFYLVMRVTEGAYRGLGPEALGPLRAGVICGLSLSLWVLGIELRYSGGIASALSH